MYGSRWEGGKEVERKDVKRNQTLGGRNGPKVFLTEGARGQGTCLEGGNGAGDKKKSDFTKRRAGTLARGPKVINGHQCASHNGKGSGSGMGKGVGIARPSMAWHGMAWAWTSSHQTCSRKYLETERIPVLYMASNCVWEDGAGTRPKRTWTQ